MRVVVIVVVMAVRVAAVRRLVRRIVLVVIRAWRVVVRVGMAGTAVPVLAHGISIRRLARGSQRVKPRPIFADAAGKLPAGMNYSHFAYNPRAHETLCRHSRL